MNALMFPTDMMKAGLLSVGMIGDTNSQTLLSGESQKPAYILVNKAELFNKFTITLEQLVATGARAAPEVNSPGQIIDVWKFVDEEEESWLQLLSSSRKKFVAEDEL